MTETFKDKVQLVVFDMAGTTVRDDQEVQHCFFVAAEKTGLKAEAEAVNAMMGWTKKRVFQTLWQAQIGADHPSYNQQVDASYTAFRETLENHYRTQPVQPTEGCLELFSWLRGQEVAIALNTGFYRKVTDIILERLGWNLGLNDQYVGSANSVIQMSVTPSEIYNNEGRPAPYMIQKAMYVLGITDPKTVVVVGDTPSDLAAGINANCLKVLGVTNGTHTRQQLEVHPHHGLLDSLHDMSLHDMKDIAI